MRKSLLIIGILLLTISSCEKDDFCLKNPVTPNLVLRFYDDVDKTTTKSVTKLYVWADGKDTIFNGVSTDSIYIPLNSLATETVYKLSNGTDVETFTINYTTEEDYVSRSCGYRILFNDVTFTTDNTWFTEFTPSTLTTIDNQDAAHVQVYY